MNSYIQRYLLLLVAFLSVLIVSPALSVMESDYEDHRFSPPDLPKVIGPRAIETTDWSPSENGVWQTFRYEDTETIALATGSPVPIISALEFGYRHATELGVNGCDLIVDQTRSVQVGSSGNELTVILIKPQIEGIPVYGAFIVLTLNHNDELMVVKALGFGSQKYGSFTLEGTEAVAIARATVKDHSGDARMDKVWLPRRTMDGRIELRSCYLVTLTPDNPQLRPNLFIDAETGELLASENRVFYDQLNGRTEGFYNPLYPQDDPVLGRFPDEWVRLDGGGQTYSDDDGEFSFEINPDDEPFRLNSELRGRWVDVDYEDGRDAFYELDVDADDDAVITWDDERAREDERMLYYHTNFIHDFWKTLDPDFDDLDYPMPAVCHVGDNFNNAYWNGYGMYFGGGGGDGVNAGRNFAMYADIIRHEYGHGITGHIYPPELMPYRDEPGALNEAWSDYFPCSISDDPLMGEGRNGGGYIRNLDNNLHYPEDIRGEVHYDSRIISAAMWHTREILGSDYCDDLFHFTRYEFGNTFLTYFVDILATDDDDGDITNGTPNYEVLYEQFGRHGIGPGIFPKITITRSELSDDRQDGANGNDDRLWEPGETIRLAIDIHRDGSLYPPPAENVRIQLRSDHPDIHFVRAEVAYGDMFVGDRMEAEQPLLFRIDRDAPISFADLYLDVIAGDDDDILLRDTIRITIGIPPILLVADGEVGHSGGNVPMSWWFESSLSELSQVYVKFVTISPVRPLDEWLDRFDTVIWFTGDAMENILNDDDRGLLAQFMDDGGNVLLTGQSAGTAAGAESFFNDYFGVSHTVDSLRGRTVQGIEDDPVARGMRLLLLGDGGARNQVRSGAVEAIEPAVEVYHWRNIDGNPAAGVRREDPISGSRTVYLSFGLEAVSSRPHRGYISRDEALGAALNWLGIETGVDNDEAILPVGFRLDDPYPNPFNASTIISYQLPERTWVSIKVYDFTGREVATRHKGWAEAGYHTVSFDGRDHASGVYFCRMEVDNFTKTVKLSLTK